MPKRIIKKCAEVQAAALSDYRGSDLTTEEIATKHGISSATLTVWAKKANIALRNRGRKTQTEPTPRQLAIVKLSANFSYEQVGKRFGMKKQSIHRIVTRWKHWGETASPPFERGDVILWRNRKFTVLEARKDEGTLREEPTGKQYKNFSWTGGRIPKKVGHVTLPDSGE
jgi:transposase